MAAIYNPLNQPRWTYGMAVYDDTPAAVFTIQYLRMVHDVRQGEILVVDNNPTSKQGEEMRNFCHKLYNPDTRMMHGINGQNQCPVRYVPYTEKQGTSAPRNKVVEEALGDYVMMLDSHVFPEGGALQVLDTHFKLPGHDMDLISGPMMFDELDVIATHFTDHWSAEMRGTWGQAWRCKCSPATMRRENDYNVEYCFDVQEGPTGKVQFVTLKAGYEVLDRCPKCHVATPDIPYDGHFQWLYDNGYRRQGWDPREPAFPIGGMGLGFLACKKSAWAVVGGYQADALGFGGEELWYHDKWRAAGGRTLCHPACKWWHKFRDSGPPPYKLTQHLKVRNYVLEYNELGQPLDDIYEHFVRGIKVPSGKPDPHFNDHKKYEQRAWDRLIADPVGAIEDPAKHFAPPPPVNTTALANPDKQAKAPRTVEQFFQLVRVDKPRDIETHFDKLRWYAGQCDHVTELTKRAETTLALATGKPKRLVSYSSEAQPVHSEMQAALMAEPRVDGETTIISVTPWRVGDLEKLPQSPQATDMIYIHSVHSGDQVYKELKLFGPYVRRWVALQSTDMYGFRAEGDAEPGILMGAHRWFEEQEKAGGRTWFRTYHSRQQYGLTVFSCNLADPSIEFGPGTELHMILSKLGIRPTEGCSCRVLSGQMDDDGVAGCQLQNRRDYYLTEMKKNQEGWGWGGWFRAATLAVWSGLAFKINPGDPLPDLYDEAVRRAAGKGAAALTVRQKELQA